MVYFTLIVSEKKTGAGVKKNILKKKKVGTWQPEKNVWTVKSNMQVTILFCDQSTLVSQIQDGIVAILTCTTSKRIIPTRFHHYPLTALVVSEIL